MTFMMHIRAGLMARPSFAEDPLTAPYIASMPTAPSATWRMSADELFKGLRADGLLPYLRRMNLPGEYLDNFLADPIQPTKKSSVVGTGTYVPLKGWKGDGSTGYVDLGENTIASAAGGGSTNNLLMGSYVTEDFPGMALQGLFGQATTAWRYGLVARSGPNELQFRTNETTTSTVARSSASFVGHRTILRPDGLTKTLYSADANMNSLMLSATGTGSTNTVIGAANGVYSRCTTGIFYAGFAVVGGTALSASMRAALDARLSTFLKKIGAI